MVKERLVYLLTFVLFLEIGNVTNCFGKENVAPGNSSKAALSVRGNERKTGYYSTSGEPKFILKIVQVNYAKLFTSPEIAHYQESEAVKEEAAKNRLDYEAIVHKLNKPRPEDAKPKKTGWNKFKDKMNSQKAEAEADAAEDAYYKGLREKADQCKMKMMDQYMEIYAIKYQVLDNKTNEILQFAPSSKREAMKSMVDQANAHYHTGIQLKKRNWVDPNFGFQELEKAAVYFHKSLECQEKALAIYLSSGQSIDRTYQAKKDRLPTISTKRQTPVYKAPAPKAAKTNFKTTPATPRHQAPHKAVASKPSTVKATVPQHVPSNKGVVYRIQIGVFSKELAPDVLARIPKVYAEAVPGKSYKKYYSGSFASIDEARIYLPQVKEAGFSGAFVVPFHNGKRITMEQARQFK